MLPYVLYACVHLDAGKHASQADNPRCVEAQAYFHLAECEEELARAAGLRQHGKHPQSWLECQETKADSWIPADASDPGSRLYKAEAGVSDENALAALLAPLSPRARATLRAGGLERPFQSAFQGPGNLSFFVAGTGAGLTVFAVTHLDDFQFADMAADFSSASEGMAAGKDLDFETMAENAGIELSYHTKTSQRTGPPPGGVESGP